MNTRVHRNVPSPLLVKNKTIRSGLNPIPLLVPELRGNEWNYLKECIETGWVSSVGGFIPRFEKAVIDRLGGGTGVALMNGTSALHLALLVSGVQPGDEIVVPAVSFVATANAVAYCGAHPVFIDVDEESWNMDVQKFRSFIQNNGRIQGRSLINKNNGRIIRAVLPVHLFGHPADMDPIVALAQEAKLCVIEDACEALGALYKGLAVGRLGNLGCLSFNGNKVVTCGGGGMVVTQNDDWAKRVRHLSTQARVDSDLFIHDEVGFNYRMTNLQAAVGLAQMERLGDLLQKKKKIADRYREAFSRVPGLECMPKASWAEPVHWLFSMRVLKGSAVVRGLRDYLKKRGIETRRLWYPLHKLPMYKDEGSYQVKFANDLFSQVVSLPSSAGLGVIDQDYIIHSVCSYMNNRRRRLP